MKLTKEQETLIAAAEAMRDGRCLLTAVITQLLGDTVLSAGSPAAVVIEQLQAVENDIRSILF